MKVSYLLFVINGKHKKVYINKNQKKQFKELGYKVRKEMILLT